MYSEEGRRKRFMEGCEEAAWPEESMGNESFCDKPEAVDDHRDGAVARKYLSLSR
jgi:hypothetical protein